MKKAILISTAIVLAMSACKKEDHAHAPKITINDPKKSEYEVGDTAYVNVVAKDEHEMHTSECWFITRPQNDTLWNQRKHAHSKTITFNTFYVIGVLPEKQQVDFIVNAENEEGIISTAKHSFEVHDH